MSDDGSGIPTWVQNERAARRAEAARAEMERIKTGTPLVTIPSADRGSLDEEEAGLLVGLVFTSKSGGTPHVVTIRREEGYPPSVVCICAAMRSIESRPAGCHGMKAARTLAGIHQP